MSGANGRLTAFGWYAWGVLAYTVGVILWGTYVRATGSGAGCGSHWPLCNGEVIPRAPEAATLIEYTHRLTSGLCLILIFGLLLYSFRRLPAGSPTRKGALVASVLIIVEALIGAGLVHFELVAEDASVARAVTVGVHLLNTFALLAALTLTAWYASGGGAFRLRGQGRLGFSLLGTFLLLALVGATGSITALGDTLFPASSLQAGLAEDFSPSAHFLVRLRILHPALALMAALATLWAARYAAQVRATALTRRLAPLVISLVVIQTLAGALNLVLLAPVWMQLVHLLLADLLWIALILLAAASSSRSSEQAAERLGRATQETRPYPPPQQVVHE